MTDVPEEPKRPRSRQPKPQPQPTPTPAPAAATTVPVHKNGNGKAPYRLSQNVVNLVAVVVSIVWAISFIADILIPEYTPPTNVHMALMVVLGGVFGSQFVKRY